MMNIDPLLVAQSLEEVASEIILPRFQNLQADDIETKTGPEDLVTIADREAEAALIQRLTDFWPGSIVIGEEGASAYPDLLASLDDKGVFWIVDPVDGTWNFAQGSERFATMVALVVQGETVMSWIYPPIIGDCAIAEKGAGATFQDKRLKARSAVSFEKSNIDYSPRYMVEGWREQLDHVTQEAASCRRGRCSAFAYLDIATGELDAILTGMIYPWDHAPGTLLIEEAGGHTAFLESGVQYTPKPHEKQPMLSVGDKAAWADYAARFKPSSGA